MSAPTPPAVEETARMLAGARTINGAPGWRELDETDRDAYRDEARRVLDRTETDQ